VKPKQTTPPTPTIDPDKLAKIEARLLALEQIHHRELAGAHEAMEHRAQAAQEADRRRDGEARRRALLARFIAERCAIAADARESARNLAIGWSVFIGDAVLPGFGPGELARDLCMLAGRDVEEADVRTSRGDKPGVRGLRLREPPTLPDYDGAAVDDVLPDRKPAGVAALTHG